MGSPVIRRNDVTTFSETHRSNMHGWTDVHWTCQTCHMNISLPQQQHISYCPHCGRFIKRTIGGGRQPVPKPDQIIYLQHGRYTLHP